MGLWPSRGIYLNGFEIKIYRSDWIKELKTPDKAEEIAQFCDFWWIVAPKEIVKIEEVPANWGLMNPHGKNLRVVKDAILLKPKRIDKPMLAAILRRAQAYITPESKVKASFKEGEALGKETAERLSEFNIKNAKSDNENLEKRIAKFQKQSGVNISQPWVGDQIGEAVKAVLDGEDKKINNKLSHLLKDAESIVLDIKNHLKVNK